MHFLYNGSRELHQSDVILILAIGFDAVGVVKYGYYFPSLHFSSSHYHMHHFSMIFGAYTIETSADGKRSW